MFTTTDQEILSLSELSPMELAEYDAFLDMLDLQAWESEQASQN